MTFKAANLVLQSVTPSPPAFGLPQFWGYVTTDDKAEVLSSGYFNFTNTLPGGTRTFFVGDQVYCVCSDGNIELQISTLGTPTGSSVTTATTPFSGTVGPSSGGTGLVDPTAHGILVTEGDAPMNPIVLGSGEILIGVADGDPVPSQIIGGDGIDVDSEDGSITISASGGGGGLNWPYGAGFLEGEGGLFTLPGTFGSTTSNTQSTPQDATNLSQNMLLIPIMCVNGFTISDWIINVATDLAGSSVNLSIYDSDPSFAFPASSVPALGGVNITTASTGFRFGSLSLALSANTLYWLGVQFSTATTLSVTAAVLNIMNQGPGISITPAAGTNVWFQPNSFVAGTYPDSLSTYTTGLEMVNFPLVIFE